MVTVRRAKRKQEHRSNSTKVAALSLLKAGVSPTRISKDMKIPRQTLYDWKSASMASGSWMGAGGDMARPAPRKKFPGTGTGNRKITTAIKRKMKRKLDRNPFLAPRGLQRLIPELRDISRSNIRRVIRQELGLPSRIAAKKPFLTEFQKERRLDWSLDKLRWTGRRWARVLWSDETHIELWKGFQHKAARVRRSSSISRYDPNFVIRTLKHPPKLMIWAAFGNSKLGRLYFVEQNAKMNAAMYKTVLQRHLKASMKMTGCEVFMQDGAPCHTARSITAWLKDSKVPVLDWVGQSCDLNPIENLWRELKQIIAGMEASTNLNDLAKKISRAWKILGRKKEFLAALTYSMPSRVQAVVDAEGDVTKY